MKLVKYAVPALALAGSLSFTAPLAQAAEVSGNVALVTDYKFRGISQSDSKPSFRAGSISPLTLASTSGHGARRLTLIAR